MPIVASEGSLHDGPMAKLVEAHQQAQPEEVGGEDRRLAIAGWSVCKLDAGQANHYREFLSRTPGGPVCRRLCEGLTLQKTAYGIRHTHTDDPLEGIEWYSGFIVGDK